MLTRCIVPDDFFCRNSNTCSVQGSVERVNLRVEEHDRIDNGRIFSTGLVPGNTESLSTGSSPDLDAACAQIRSDLIGRLDSVATPFGEKPLVCKYPTTKAMSRPRDFMRDRVASLFPHFVF